MKDNSLPELDSIPDFTGKYSVLGFDNLEPYGCFTNLFSFVYFCLLPMKQTDMLKAFYLRLKNSRPGLGITSGKMSMTKLLRHLFVAVEIGKGLVHKATLESHFQDTYWLTQNPGFNTIFKRDKYQLISPSFIFPTMMMTLRKLTDFQKSSP